LWRSKPTYSENYKWRLEAKIKGTFNVKNEIIFEVKKSENKLDVVLVMFITSMQNLSVKY
jgi:hypothetical protein